MISIVGGSAWVFCASEPGLVLTALPAGKLRNGILNN